VPAVSPTPPGTHFSPSVSVSVLRRPSSSFFSSSSGLGVALSHSLRSERLPCAPCRMEGEYEIELCRPLCRGRGEGDAATGVRRLSTLARPSSSSSLGLRGVPARTGEPREKVPSRAATRERRLRRGSEGEGEENWALRRRASGECSSSAMVKCNECECVDDG
jgi:hypothetical protein